jgi:hypothetical protein
MPAAAELEPILNSTSDPEEALNLRLLLAALKIERIKLTICLAGAYMTPNEKFGRDDVFRLAHYFEIAARLAIRMLADELLKFYVDFGRQMFRSIRQSNPLRPALRILSANRPAR